SCSGSCRPIRNPVEARQKAGRASLLALRTARNCRGRESRFRRRCVSYWPTTKARRVFAALLRMGWRHDRTVGSHRILREEWPEYPFSFHDSEELDPAILAKVSKKTGL